MVKVKIPWNAPLDTPSFTGTLYDQIYTKSFQPILLKMNLFQVSPHVSMLLEMLSVKEEFHWVKESMLRDLKKELVGRSVGDPGFFS